MRYYYALLLSLALLGMRPVISTAEPLDQSRLASTCDSLLAEQFHADEPGAAALVARNGRILYKKAFGVANLELPTPMRTDHVFRIGSITKQMTAVAILQLAEQGKLRLQDDITTFIPDYPTQGNTITIEHLLTHTSGIRNYSGIVDTTHSGAVDYSPTEMIDYFKNQPMRFAPGAKWEYSNSNYFLLGYIIELITGGTYRDYIERHLFAPAGMTSSLYASDRRIVRNRADGYSKGDHGFENAEYLSMTQPYAAGAVQSTVEDLFIWHQALYAHKLVSRESLDRALARYTMSTGEQTSYGYGFRFGYIQGSPSVWHGGMINGYITMAMYLPNEDVFVAVFSNCDCNSPEDVTAKLAAVAIGEPYDFHPSTVDDTTLAGYVGVYENSKGHLRVITAADGRLFSQSGRGPCAGLSARRHDWFALEDDNTQQVLFDRDARGVVTRLTTRSRRAIDTWQKTTKPVPSPDGIRLDERTLELYVGEYEIAPDFTFVVTRTGDRLFVKATGQETIEIFAESPTTFFMKVNDAQLEFVTDDRGNASKVILTQGGRTTDAKRIATH